MLERWRPGAWWKLPRGMCRQRAGCNPGTAKADGQRASWKLPRGSWRVLRVLSVWSLANGRLECPNKRGLCAGKGQAAMLERWRPGAWCAARDVQAKGRLQPWNSKGWRPEGFLEAAARKQRSSWRVVRVLRLERWRPRAWWKLPRGMCRKRAGCKPGTAKADGQRAWWKLPRGSWRVLRVLSVWSLANGRLECPNKRGLCAGKGQAATLEQQRLTARGLGGSCREGCAGKGQAATLEQQRLPARGLGGSCREEAVQQLEVEAAARELEGFKGFKRLKPGKRQAWMP